MRDYGRVHSTFWSSKTIASLSDDGKMLALYLMTCSHNTIAGVFRLPDGYVSEDIKWEQTRVAKGFAELLQKGFANRCETTKWVWIIKHLDWNPPENPNQRKAAAKCAQSIPDDCIWKRAFMEDRGCSLGLVQPPNGSETVRQPSPEPFLNQKQEQEQEQKSSGAEAPRTRRARQTPLPADFCVSDRVRRWAEAKGYGDITPHFDAFVSYAKRKGAVYADWDEALMNAIRNGWGGKPPPKDDLDDMFRRGMS